MNNVIEINDITAPELDVYARTSEVQLLRYYEPKPGIFIAESPKVIHFLSSVSIKTWKGKQRNFWNIIRKFRYILQNMMSL